MLNSHLIRCRLGSVVLIRVDSEVDSAANRMLLPEGSGGTPLLRGLTACSLAHAILFSRVPSLTVTICDIFSHTSSVARGMAVSVCQTLSWSTTLVQTEITQQLLDSLTLNFQSNIHGLRGSLIIPMSFQ